jgi:hypothetical protein
MEKALLFAILALSINALAQTKHPALNLQRQPLNSKENVQGTIGNKEWKTSGFYSEKKSQERIKHQTPEQRELIRIFDSVYNWQLDPLSNGWRIYSKTINMVYDSKNNLINQLYQLRFSPEWVNSWQRANTYDADNFEKSDSYKEWNDTGTKVTSGDSGYYYFHTHDIGINEMMLQGGGVFVYPNPSTSNITIETTTEGHLTILNPSGTELLSHEITGLTTTIDISTLPSGVYFVKLTGDRTV